MMWFKWFHGSEESVQSTIFCSTDFLRMNVRLNHFVLLHVHNEFENGKDMLEVSNLLVGVNHQVSVFAFNANLVPRVFSLAWGNRPQTREKTLGTRLSLTQLRVRFPRTRSYFDTGERFARLKIGEHFTLMGSPSPKAFSFLTK